MVGLWQVYGRFTTWHFGHYLELDQWDTLRQATTKPVSGLSSRYCPTFTSVITQFLWEETTQFRSFHPWLVGGIPTPLKNMSSSLGMMTFPTEWKNKSLVPNHQPAVVTIIIENEKYHHGHGRFLNLHCRPRQW